MSETNTPTLLKRVPIFQDFTDSQIEKVTNITTSRALEQGTVLFLEGDPSIEMHIVLEGVLQIQSGTGSEIANVRPMGIVGEMGALTHQPRSATVVAQSEAKVLAIPTKAFHHLIENDADMGLKVYRSVTHMLCDHLRDNNMLIEQQLFMLEDLS